MLYASLGASRTRIFTRHEQKLLLKSFGEIWHSLLLSLLSLSGHTWAASQVKDLVGSSNLFFSGSAEGSVAIEPPLNLALNPPPPPAVNVSTAVGKQVEGLFKLRLHPTFSNTHLSSNEQLLRPFAQRENSSTVLALSEYPKGDRDHRIRGQQPTSANLRCRNSTPPRSGLIYGRPNQKGESAELDATWHPPGIR
jgi:hypothetical protein